jgi:hypothetical protein
VLRVLHFSELLNYKVALNIRQRSAFHAPEVYVLGVALPHLKYLVCTLTLDDAQLFMLRKWLCFGLHCLKRFEITKSHTKYQTTHSFSYSTTRTAWCCSTWTFLSFKFHQYQTTHIFSYSTTITAWCCSAWTFFKLQVHTPIIRRRTAFRTPQRLALYLECSAFVLKERNDVYKPNASQLCKDTDACRDVHLWH